METIDLLNRSTCPYCRGSLSFTPVDRTSVDTGTARCACYTYPVVDGIIVLRQLSGRSDAVDPAAECLHAGDVDAARRQLRRHGSMVADHDATPDLLRRATAAVRRRVGSRDRGAPAAVAGGDAAVRRAFTRCRPQGFADYLFQRYANPSFMAAVPAMSVVRSAGPASPAPTILDIGCGVGHSTAVLSAFVPHATVVAADPDFVNLELLRRYFAPDAVCVCIDAELPLPFDDHVFDAVVCLDAFHYIRSKWALAGELERVITDEGMCVLPHLHNARVPNVSPGVPLPPGDYVRMFRSLDARLYDEADLLDRVVRDASVDLAAAPPLESLDEVPNLTMVASRRPETFGTFELTKVRDLSIVGVNPIYAARPQDGGTLLLEAHWPNADLERECRDAHRHLPPRITLDRALLERLASMTLAAADETVVHDLLLRSVLVELPVGYERLPALLRRIADERSPDEPPIRR